MRLTIVRDYAHAAHLGATGPNGRLVMPDGSRAMSLRSVRGGAHRGLTLEGYTLAEGVELDDETRAELEVATHVARVTAADAGGSLTLAMPGVPVTASATSRTLGGLAIRYGDYGRTSAGRLKVRPGALRFPADLSRVKLTHEHDRDRSRGYLTAVEDTEAGVRVSARVSDGPEGDAALREAADKTRDGFSFDVVDATVEGDELTDGLVVAIGQVGIPAFDETRIDTIAASAAPTTGTTTQEVDHMLTDAQRARLTELEAKTDRTPEEEAELGALQVLAGLTPTASAEPEPAAAPAAPAVAASMPAVPAGVPARTTASSSTTAVTRGRSLSQVYADIVEAIRPGGGGAAAITAALADVTHTAHTGNVEPTGWAGELWSGQKYEPQYSDLFASSSLTNWKGEGWRFTATPAMQDYAGDKAAIPTGAVSTESDNWEAARMAVGVDIDRKFYDFPNEAFLAGLFERVRETWEVQLDAKVRAYTLAKAVAAEAVAAQSDLLKAAAYGVRALKRRKVGSASWVLVNDDDMMTLFDRTEDKLPAYLDLWGIDPRNFRATEDIPAGTVLVGRREAADVKTLPGSPIRVSAQHLANGGVDEAFFGYWAIQEHHTEGIAKVTFAAPA